MPLHLKLPVNIVFTIPVNSFIQHLDILQFTSSTPNHVSTFRNKTIILKQKNQNTEIIKTFVHSELMIHHFHRSSVSP